MSLLGRLFGSRPAPPPANSVVVPEDVAARLTADGTPLQASVDAVLRSFLEARDRPEPDGAPGIPFWLDRHKASAAGETSDLGDELRDRVIQRHTAEGDS